MLAEVGSQVQCNMVDIIFISSIYEKILEKNTKGNRRVLLK